MIYSLKELVNYAKKNSSFYKSLYRDLYKDLEKEEFCIEDLPLVPLQDFWKKNENNESEVLTGDFTNGVLFKSGGTTGDSKSSLFSKIEWETFTEEFSKGFKYLGLAEGDRAANLFYSGELYASFLFITKAIEKSEIPFIHFPITGQTDHLILVGLIKEHKINVLMGVPSSFMTMLGVIEPGELSIDKIYFGGESLFPEQKEKLEKYFPGVLICSIGYASVDAGHLGYSKKTSETGVHHVFSSTLMEIIDEETGLSITETHTTGKLIYTNLTRTLMPIIRFPVGDRAHWIEYGTSFKLMGRSEEGARIGPVTVLREDIISSFSLAKASELIQHFQLKIERRNNKDYLVVLIVFDKKCSQEELISKVKTEFYYEKKMYKDCVDKELIAEAEFLAVNVDDLEFNQRTGKIRPLVDNRK